MKTYARERERMGQRQMKIKRVREVVDKNEKVIVVSMRGKMWNLSTLDHSRKFHSGP